MNATLEKAGYISSPEIELVLDLAQFLDKPILIEGPSGTGKTQLAVSYAKASQRELIRIQCYEGITSSEIIGEWNYHRQLIRIQLAAHQQHQDQSVMEDVFHPDYFISRPLMRAFTESAGPAILLIDEIDRSDEEFEAFLLEALGEKQITIPELGTFRATRDILVFLTSNATRDLSEALRRRCLFLYLDFPNADREEQILRLHSPATDGRLLKDVVAIAQALRTPEAGLRKVPSIAEAIDWSRALVRLSQRPSLRQIEDSLGVLVKHWDDLEKAKKMLNKLEESLVLES
ncbi:MAG: AAA family ATPase [Candidatus Hodarchaeales archaeon]|jgi:MoxR-like ATPase